jgi:hypothetical protein
MGFTLWYWYYKKTQHKNHIKQIIAPRSNKTQHTHKTSNLGRSETLTYHNLIVSRLFHKLKYSLAPAKTI